MQQRKVVVAGETWSANLGDGAIAESLRYLLKRANPDLQVDFLDISGRSCSISQCGDTVVTPTMSPAKEWVRRRSWLTAPRNFMKWWYLKSRHLPQWSSLISQADAVIVGGGQLLIDNDWSFPLKINLVSRLAYSLGKEVYIVACGVGEEWSPFASRLFGSVLRPATDITVRDTRSLERLGSHLPDLKVSLSSDPALWSSGVYGREQKRQSNVVGLGIISVDSFNRYSNINLSTDGLAEFWVRLAKKLYIEGVRFQLFTNGSVQDYAFAEYVHRSIERCSISCSLVDRPTRPQELARCISQYDAIIASRLHAHIIATSYAIPSIGLVWDDKVESFFRDTGRPWLAFDSVDMSFIDAIVAALLKILNTRVSEDMLRRQQLLIADNVHNIVAKI